MQRTENLAALIIRIAPNHAGMTLADVVACVRHHIGGCRDVDVEDALLYLAE